MSDDDRIRLVERAYTSTATWNVVTDNLLRVLYIEIPADWTDEQREALAADLEALRAPGNDLAIVPVSRRSDGRRGAG